jgi:hypothetical protein
MERKEVNMIKCEVNQIKQNLIRLPKKENLKGSDKLKQTVRSEFIRISQE